MVGSNLVEGVDLAFVLAQHLHSVVVRVERVHQHKWHVHLERLIQVLSRAVFDVSDTKAAVSILHTLCLKPEMVS